MARGDQGSGADEAGILAKLGRHDADVPGEAEPGMHGKGLAERLEKQRSGLGQPPTL